MKAGPGAQRVDHVIIEVDAEIPLPNVREFAEQFFLTIEVNGQSKAMIALNLLPTEPWDSGRFVWRPEWAPCKEGDDVTVTLESFAEVKIPCRIGFKAEMAIQCDIKVPGSGPVPRLPLIS